MFRRDPNHDSLSRVIGVLVWARLRGYKVAPGYTITQFEDPEETRVYVTVLLERKP